MYPAVVHKIQQHTALSARLAAASILKAELLARLVSLGLTTDDATATTSASTGPLSIPLYADSMSNAASLAFGALPERLVVIQDGRVRKGKATAALQTVYFCFWAQCTDYACA